MRSDESLWFRLATVVTVAAVVLFVPDVIQASGPKAITISGGGVGEFLDPNPCDGFNEEGPFGVSNFAVSAQIDEDGNVHGNFMCQVKGCIVIVLGVFTDVLGIDQADGPDDQDTVFLLGEAAFVDLSKEVGGPGVVKDENGDPFIFEFCIELREGPPSVGRFFYTD